MRNVLNWCRSKSRAALAALIRKKEFQDVPFWLTERIATIKDSIDISNRDDVYFHAAAWVIAFYLQKDISIDASDGYFDSKSATGTNAAWHQHANRVVLVGETLFLLRSSPGFPEFIRRLKQRTLRAAFFEMLAAKQFFKAGFAIHARPEIGVRGEDFDFTAVRGDDQINVEVTALTAPAFSEQTILNALQQKRSQLPNTAPAIIFCVLPDRWFEDRADLWNEKLPGIANRFLAGTERINAIKFWTEVNIETGDKDGAALHLVSIAFTNPRARIDVWEIGFLFEGTPVSEGITATVTRSGRKELTEASNSSEFFRWVEHIISTK
jgi:hypothetical protein